MKTVEERIKLFKFVRDVPYYIAVDLEQDYCCTTKSVMLQKLLASEDIESRLIRCTFSWEESNLPKEILDLFKDKEEAHQYLEVKIPESGQWVKVDPTWDIKLSNLFEISEWDGLHDTLLAVQSTKTFSPEESLKLALEEDIGDTEVQEYLKRNKDFYIAVNKWLEENRTIF
jgi:hypothetical protein